MKVKILVVDDRIERRKWLKKLLEEKGYYVDISTDGMAALVKIKSSRGKFNLVLTDTKMPCLTGPELVADMKERKIMVPVIGMSNREESRVLYEYFWNKNEAYENLFSLIKKLTKKSS
ncbi:MAG: response regulator [Candidatus Parcubacteria bacterium]|nr:response regulator [Candidatus Parcubacteria bacterium]